MNEKDSDWNEAEEKRNEVELKAICLASGLSFCVLKRKSEAERMGRKRSKATE